MRASESVATACAGGELPRVVYEYHAHDDPAARWLVVRARIDERVSATYEAQVDLVSAEGDDPARLLGSACTLVVRRDDARRCLHGIVARVEVGERGIAGGVQVSIVPALAALAQSSDCRIFADMTVPDVVVRVLTPALAHHDRQIRRRLRRSDYPVREYVVQYGESDLAFVERLLAEEGIWYCFAHPDGTTSEHAEVLCLLDDNEEADDAALGPAGASIAVESAHDGIAYRQALTRFVETARLSTTGVAVRTTNWTNPRVPAQDSVPRGDRGDRPRYEPEDLTLHRYQAERYGESDARAQARLRQELHHGRAVRAHGHGNVVGLCPGQQIEVVAGPHSEPRRWIVVALRAHGRDAKNSTQAVAHLEDYQNEITCALASRPLRPRRPPKPRVHGVQTATVVGPDGKPEVAPGADDVHVDAHGRVRVKLAWDRTQGDRPGAATSSCFVRVAQAWAGSGFGVVFTPRIGMEVVVSFVDGDPDRPLITGCLYNGLNRAPLALPAHKTESGIRTRSSPSGQGGSALWFDDADGHERVTLHAQRDHDERVARDQHVRVGGEQRVEVGARRTQRVGGDDIVHIDGGRTTVVQGAEVLAVAADRVLEVRGSDEKRIEKHRRLEVVQFAREHYDGGRVVQVQGSDRLHVPAGGHKQDHVTGKYAIRADTQFKVAQGAGELVMEDGLYASVSGDIQLKNPGFHLHAGADGATTLKITRELVLEVGRASIVLTAGGAIEIRGVQCSMVGKDGTLTLTPAGASLTSKQLTEIGGALVRIN